MPIATDDPSGTTTHQVRRGWEVAVSWVSPCATAPQPEHGPSCEVECDERDRQRPHEAPQGQPGRVHCRGQLWWGAGPHFRRSV